MDTSGPPIILMQSEDKAMPLDLSCRKASDEEERDDEVIVTLEIPGHRSHTSHEPIVIPSDSDSDSDVTVLSIDVKTPKHKKSVKLLDSVKLMSDSDDDSCILSAYQGPPPQYSTVGLKKFYDPSPLQNSIMSSDAILDPIVKGKDPFLSDASMSNDDRVSPVGLMMSSGDTIGNEHKVGSLDFEDSVSPISLHFGLLDTKSILPAMTPGCVAVSGCDTSLVDSVDSSATKLSSKLTVGTQHSISDLISDVALPKSTDLASTDCASSDGLSFGITQLLSSPNKASNTTLLKESKSTVDLSSVFHVSSFDRLFLDKQSTSDDVDKDRDRNSERKLSRNVSDLKSCFRVRPRSLRLKPRSTGTGSFYRKLKSLSQSSHAYHCTDDPSSVSCKKINEDWKVISNNCKNKVVLRRFDGKGTSPLFLRKRDPSSVFSLSPNSARKKSRCSFEYVSPREHRLDSDDSSKSVEVRSPLALSPSNDYSDSKLDSEVESKASFCYGCKIKVVVGHLSFCMAGHGCCGQCLQSQVKTLLARGKKGTLKCRYVGCNSFYLVSQLRNSLPSMVVEILEEKLDREYCDNAARLMMQGVNKAMIEMIADDDADDRALARIAKNTKEEQHNLPPGWEPMSQSEEYRLVDLLRGSEEYNYIAGAFHMTMLKPRANIVKIQRVQNTILWEFYMVKKKQMERDSGKPVLEKSLFHGTHRTVVDAICRTNFDWRLCGLHGTMYGQGSYFARDSVYSHIYTDQAKGSQPAISIHSSNPMIFNAPPSHHQGTAGSSAAQIIFQAFPGSSHSVSIAALQSCRFARLPVLNNAAHLSHGPPAAAQGSSGSSAPAPVSAFSFPYWVGNSGGCGPVSSNKIGRIVSEGGVTLSPSGSTTAPHVHTMFVARVLVGEYTLGKNGYRKPPPIDPAAPYGRCYDACVNDMSNPTIFVVFNSAQCYPEYIIEYTNHKGSKGPEV